MPTPGRNDPCPCGSGKKYKKCCLGKDQAVRSERAEAARPSPTAGAVPRCLEWLERTHPDETIEALEDYVSVAGDDARERLRTLGPEYGQMVQINCHEWLLADADLYLEGQDVPVRELLLGPGGPLLTAAQRAWIEAITARPLGLYEVTEVTPGEGFRARDLFHPGEPSVEVADRAASESLVRWDVFGARLVSWQGRWVMSGAIYPLLREGDFPARLRDLRAELARETEGDPDLERAFLSVEIPQEWLLDLLEPRMTRMPDLVDTATGDPVVMVTDHYRVRDWQRLEQALAEAECVEGSRKLGAWTRLSGGSEEGESARILLSLTPKSRDRLETIAHTRPLGDQGRRWLENLAGDALEHRTREISDPHGHLAAAGRTERPGPARARTRHPSAGETAMTTEIMEHVLHDQYRTWADDEIPALGGRTPREAVRTPEGREDVIGLLKLYERGEERRAREENRTPASLQFLWDAVGLERDAVLARTV